MNRNKGIELFPVGSEVSLREAFGRILCYEGENRNDFVLFDADVAGGTGAKPFVEKFPERVIQFGIAEQNMVAAAAGFSTVGITPIVSTFSVFGLMRAHEQFRTAVTYGNRNVKLCCSHLGLDVGPDGPTAQMLEDIAISRSIPGLTVVVPADANEFMMAFSEILNHKGPLYMRIGRSPAPVIFSDDHEFKLGTASILRNGHDIAIVACGVMVARALDASEILKEDHGIESMVINLSTIKPLDRDTIIKTARTTGAILTAEDHNILGGLGSAVAEVVVREYPVPMEYIGVEDRFGRSGEPEDLAKFFGLTAENIVDKAIELIKRKG